MQFYSFWKRIVYRSICSPCVFLVLRLFIVLVDFLFNYKGKTLTLITPVPNHCDFFSYSQTLFAILLVYIFNKFCVCSFMLRIYWSFHDVFLKLVTQSSNWQFKQGIRYPLSDLISSSRDLTIPHLDLSHFALCIMGN